MFFSVHLYDRFQAGASNPASLSRPSEEYATLRPRRRLLTKLKYTSGTSSMSRRNASVWANRNILLSTPGRNGRPGRRGGDDVARRFHGGFARGRVGFEFGELDGQKEKSTTESPNLD